MDNIDRQPKDPVFSIIIPCRTIDKYTERCIQYCQMLNNSKEIIVVTDEDCPGLPATKRNVAMQYAKGAVYAFIDADAFPSMDWLNNASIFLNDFPAVCGPGILPYDATFREKATDLVLRCLPYSYRVAQRTQRIVAEFPTFNLLVKKEYATKFKSYLTGEDTLFCRAIKQGILYDPNIVVYHSRRPLFFPYWKQISVYGWHRGHLIGLAILGWFTTGVVYSVNFIRGIIFKVKYGK
jgi:glycosyltransferase involved in cell wall biosynthesis